MDGVQRGKVERGEREEAIKRDLEGGGIVPIKDLIAKGHPKQSVYCVLKRLKERGEGRYVKVERSGKMVTAFQLVEREAPYEEVKMSMQLLSDVNPVLRKEAAKDLMALASKYEIISSEAVDFLVDNWHQPRYAEVQKYLLTTLFTITLTAKAKGFYEVVDKVKRTTDNLLEVAKNFSAPPELREDAWGLLILLEEPRNTDTAFELLTREEEQEGVMSFVIGQIKRYADENPLDAKRRLYNILLRTGERTPTHQRILSLLQAIR